MLMRNYEIYHITLDDDKIGVKPEVLVGMYSAIIAKSRQLAPPDIKTELAIAQDGRTKTMFHIQVSSRMAPHLIMAIQQQADSQQGIGLKSYFYKLQEQIMAQLLAGEKDVIS